ncbi:hypothetical protein KIH23_08190 [Flavobacterium sp. CYK-55]|uniref:DUF6770 family protein n=1 Tax=Flavobacterium sp. CYK-55 TaxID=2835529 RepID=UPI001BD1AD63|nr:DUF6770 family protein [Flavobacterium sp. CYK-55]MBS7787276.1 hypothetical protein [Flavobacterium sp. CYK-55]
MKLKCLFALSLLFSLQAFAQLSSINGVGTFEIRNAGAILDKNRDVDGYYFYYVMDKLKGGNNEFAIQILDKNLNEVAKKSYVDNKNTFLMKSSFNNQAMMFVTCNLREKKIELLTFDKTANQKESVKIPLESNEIRYLQMQQQTGDFNVLFPVDNKGFLFNKFEDNKKMGYSLKYYPTDGGKAWEYNSPEDSKEILSINPIEVNEKYVVALEASRPNIMSRKITIRTKVIDVNTGKLLFERENSRQNKPRLINNAFLTENNDLILMGEYFKDGDNILSDKSLGLFSEIIDINGNTKKEVFNSWKDDISKLTKSSGNFIDERGYVYFHKIVRTQTNEYYAIGEYFKKTVSAAGIGLAILSQGNAATTQLTISDAVVFKFNSDFKLVKIQDFAKSVSRAPSISDFGSPQLNANALKSFGAFDYEYTQVDPVNDRFFSCFIDYERLKGEKNKNAFKTIIYDEGTLSEDKIYLQQEGKSFRVLPAKIGNVLLVEYDKKKKEISLHLEKINIK